jgi:L-ascorbate metabolism protein UlaG (beta-lactamase superfamily)
MEIRFLGHACFELTEGDANVLIDPFLTGNPKAAAAPDELEPTHILLTHGHADHFGDVEDIAKRTGAQVVAVPEITNELGEAGVDNVADPNLGGTVTYDWGWVKMVPAWHTSTTPKGSPGTAAGFLVQIGGTTVYHLGDTALFSDMKLVAGRGDPIDVALIPIGGHYTMDRIDAATAAQFVGAGTVIPCHYDTFPPIETDVQAFKSDVESETSSEVVILEPGETFSA